MKTKTIRKKIGKTIRFYMFIGFIFFLFSASAQNNPPIAVSDTISVMSEDTVAIQVLLNDYDPDGDNIFVRSSYNPQHGNEWKNDSLVFYCSDYYSGQDSLRYKIKDDGDPYLQSERVYIYVNVIENPNLPSAEDDFAITLSQLPVEINVLLNDSDPNGDEIKIMEVTQPVHGEVNIISDSILIYKSINYIGLDSLVYRVAEKNSSNNYFSNWVTVYINNEMNPNIPEVTNDSAIVLSFETTEINVLINDFDPNGDEIMVMEVGYIDHGDVIIFSDSVITYKSNYIEGLDSLSYRVLEKNSSTNYYSDWATIYITVEKNPNIPVVVEDFATVLAWETIEINALANDMSPTGNPIELFEVDYGIILNDSIIQCKFFPNVIGFQTINYRIRELNDTTMYSEWGTISITVEENPSLPKVIDDYATTTGGIIITTNVIENDYNPTNDTIIVIPQGVSSMYGRAEVISDSIIQYTPYYSFEGIDSISYTITKTNEFIPYIMGYLIVEVQSSGSYAILEGNNIRAGINSFGCMFGKLNYIPGIGPTNFQPSFEVPAGSGKHSIFLSNLWIGGLDAASADSLHFAGERYKQVGNDYFNGPISNTYDDNYDRKYIRVWSLTEDQIGYHINHYTDPGYEIHQTIASWPANGDVSNGQLEQMAPFEDRNANGIYEPMQGDFPLIRGDQAIFFIFNDDRYIHTESTGTKLGVEIHAMAYSYNGLSDSALANTVFVHYDIINRSDTTYYDTYFASFTDLDIDYANDDYIGCDIERGSFFGYDANISKEAGLAAQSVSILAGPFMDEDGIDNPSNNCDESINGLNFGNGIDDDERLGMTKFMYFNNGGYPATSDPVIAPEYYSYMQGLWKDLTPMQYGGTGHLSNPGTVGPDCKFMFPGDSDSCNWGTYGIAPNGGYNQNGKYWTEETGDNGVPNSPSDRRGLGVSGPFTFEAGETQEFDLAFVFARDYSTKDVLSAKDILFQRIDSITHYVQSKEIIEFNEALDIKESLFENLEVLVYPNPTSSELFFTTTLKDTHITYSILDISGKTIVSGQLQNNTHSSINIDKLDVGIYLLLIKSDNRTLSSKFIKY